MSETLARWDNWSGGHWGNSGPLRAGTNQWGGVNMVHGPDGSLAVVSTSRIIPADLQNGTVWGMFWAWGIDGRVYFLQQLSPTLFKVFAMPVAFDGAVTVQDYGAITGVASVDPDWVAVGSSVYMTVWGSGTYEIKTSEGNMTLLTGSYGNAPAGRAICLYGERLLIGGVNDLRFGNRPNRIVFSGDDTGNDPTNRNAWETLNYFDVGADDALITALLPIRDYLVIISNDQQIWVMTGVPGVNATVRRVYGFHKGSGAVENFQPGHAAVDPSQIRVWFYDHTYRSVARFNGATVLRSSNFGTPTTDRAGTTGGNGPVVMIGGPDELVAHGIVLGRNAGGQFTADRLTLLRLAGIDHVVSQDVIGKR